MAARIAALEKELAALEGAVAPAGRGPRGHGGGGGPPGHFGLGAGGQGGGGGGRFGGARSRGTGGPRQPAAAGVGQRRPPPKGAPLWSCGHCGAEANWPARALQGVVAAWARGTGAAAPSPSFGAVALVAVAEPSRRVPAPAARRAAVPAAPSGEALSAAGGVAGAGGKSPPAQSADASEVAMLRGLLAEAKKHSGPLAAARVASLEEDLRLAAAKSAAAKPPAARLRLAADKHASARRAKEAALARQVDLRKALEDLQAEIRVLEEAEASAIAELDAARAACDAGPDVGCPAIGTVAALVAGDSEASPEVLAAAALLEHFLGQKRRAAGAVPMAVDPPSGGDPGPVGCGAAVAATVPDSPDAGSSPPGGVGAALAVELGAPGSPRMGEVPVGLRCLPGRPRLGALTRRLRPPRLYSSSWGPSRGLPSRLWLRPSRCISCVCSRCCGRGFPLGVPFFLFR